MVNYVTGLRTVCLSLIFGLLSACASSDHSKLILQEHPLVGKIWDIKKKAFVERADLIQAMLASEFILLGERHDNRVHHQYQAWVIKQLRQANNKASVAFEMIDDRQGNLLARHRVKSVDYLIDILNQYKTHWYYEQRYKGLFETVLSAGYPIIPANLNRQRLNNITKQGQAKLPKAYKKMLVPVPFMPEHQKALQQEIKSSHCNMLDDKMAQKMVLSQRVRDAVMAHSLTKIRTPVKVFIAGAGHVRKDRGVPLYLAQYKKGAKILTLGFTEVEAGENDVLAYSRHWGSPSLPFDYVWFTPTVKRKDLCAQFKRHMRKKAQSGLKNP